MLPFQGIMELWDMRRIRNSQIDIVILEIYRYNGKEHGNYFRILGVCHGASYRMTLEACIPSYPWGSYKGIPLFDRPPDDSSVFGFPADNPCCHSESTL